MNIKQTEMEGGERQHGDAYKTERRRDGGKRQYGGMNMKQVEGAGGEGGGASLINTADAAVQ